MVYIFFENIVNISVSLYIRNAVMLSLWMCQGVQCVLLNHAYNAQFSCISFLSVL